jgi:hypothetical protein
MIDLFGYTELFVPKMVIMNSKNASTNAYLLI